MSLPIIFNNTTYPAGYLGTDDGVPKSSFKVDNAATFSVSVNGTVNKIGDTVTLTFGADAPNGYAGTTATLTATQYDNTGQILFSSPTMPPSATDPSTSGWRYLLSNTPVHGKYLADGTTADPNRTTFTADSNDPNLNDYSVSQAPCFVTGTRIRTERGDVAVEELRVGDHVVTATGATRSIVWIGHSTVDCRRHATPHDVMPVRVAANAFGAGLPLRALHLSPGHPVLVGADADNDGGHLVPIMCLVNGTTIERVSVTAVTYWHVELDAHDILLAEGLPAESYLDWGDRAFFSESAAHRLANPDFVVPGLVGRCRPVAVDGAIVEAERLRLDSVFANQLAGPCAWPGAGVAV